MSASKLNIASRIAASLLGGYAFTWGCASFGLAALVALSVDFHEAETAMQLMAFLVFLCVFLWAFISHSVTRVWVVLAGGGVLMTVAAWAVQRAALT